MVASRSSPLSMSLGHTPKAKAHDHTGGLPMKAKDREIDVALEPRSIAGALGQKWLTEGNVVQRGWGPPLVPEMCRRKMPPERLAKAKPSTRVLHAREKSFKHFKFPADGCAVRELCRLLSQNRIRLRPALCIRKTQVGGAEPWQSLGQLRQGCVPLLGASIETTRGLPFSGSSQEGRKQHVIETCAVSGAVLSAHAVTAVIATDRNAGMGCDWHPLRPA